MHQVHTSVNFVLLFTLLDIASATFNTLQNIQVTRYIDVSSQLVIVNTHINVINRSDKPIFGYMFIVDSQWMASLAFMSAYDEQKNYLQLKRNNEYNDNGNTVMQYEIIFQTPLSSNGTTNIAVSNVFTNYLKSFPASVKQYENHKVLFSFNAYYYSAYFSQQQTTYVYIGTTKIASIDGNIHKISNDNDYGLQYGPYSHVDPLKYHQTTTHYENNSPFLIAEKLKRHIKISHWGYINVWDQILIIHTGPKLKGPYERPYTHLSANKDKNPNDPNYFDTRIEYFVSTLPISAFDVYLKDDIGLIWSYSVDDDLPHYTKVEITPRTVMYGGWKTNYEIGYSLPISDFLYHYYDDKYVCKIPIVDKIFEKMVIKEAEINIILPEWGEFVSMDPYFEINNSSNDRYCYYFDIICSEVISFKVNNLVENHITDLQIMYSFPKIGLLTKPLTFIVVFFLIIVLLKLFVVSSAGSDKPHTTTTIERNKPVEHTLNKKSKKGSRNKYFRN